MHARTIRACVHHLQTMSDAFFGKMSSMKGSRAGYCVRMAARIDRCSDERTADDVLMCSSLLYLRNMISRTQQALAQ